MLWNLTWALLAVAMTFYLLVYVVKQGKSVAWWYILFFFSGFPALLYQIVWQRALFTLYGVNIQSVTMVVTAFMVGLGLGSLVGGWISRQKVPLLLVFGLAEIAISLYGIVSLHIFHWAAIYTAGVPPLQTGLIAFVLVAVPTMLMGSTLPLLVAYTVRMSGNVGTSVGALYAVNTLGSAAACFLAGFFIMRHMGESGSVRLAAVMNAGVGVIVLGWYAAKRSRGVAKQFAAAAASGPAETVSRPAAPAPVHESSSPLLNFPLAMVTVAVAGFIALAYEILWYRLFSFTTAGMAKSFAYLLGAYLVGIALGSLLAERLCQQRVSQHLFFRLMAVFVLFSNILGFMVAPLLADIVTLFPYTRVLPLIGLAAGALGVTFPLICHVSIRPDEDSGARLSYLYLSNIIGSALGSYIVGFVLMDYLNIRQISILLALLGIGLAMALTIPAGLAKSRLTAALAGSLVVAVAIVLSAPQLYYGLYERLLFKHAFMPETAFIQTSETRSGVINVAGDNTVFGGGIYDGRYNIDLVHDVNGIFRAYFASCMHPDPKEVLMVGFSSGSWAEVIANNPHLKSMTIVEINPGYLDLLTLHPAEAAVLRNPKVKIVIDDGRRWLIRNPDRKFDMIIMNTSYNWRAHISNLLSVDFLHIVRKHLSPGGIHYYNTTSSEEVQATGVSVFPYGLRVANFMMLSDSPIVVNKDRWRDELLHYTLEGRPVFDLSREVDQRAFQRTLALAADGNPNLEFADSIRARTAGARIITDDNMGTEWSDKAGVW
jgi:spermidine synthase